MASPTRIERTQFFYAAGNTPAVNLVQHLPPGDDASIPLLGCGDVRNVLFTAYADASPNISKKTGRQLDITCCDQDAEVIARNILLYTLLLDDQAGLQTYRTWEIYYHHLSPRKH
ncbi:hypothetical protein EJ08DRAFT_692880 [Tothia fuscella]|uniref:DUF4470 domain-containing protein n=1 Tax=Tothia fuscella TaxID=1048955 RepID=A0A9P4U1S6_9PEZI|nr:hypothetical protein EJ08DRAFT_692880 [Tothia fuscella]